jgi:hypothetical protein
MPTRRQFLQTGLLGGVLLAGAAWWAAPRTEPLPSAVPPGLAWLGAADAVLIGAIAPVILGLPDVPRPLVIEGVDRAVLALPAGVRQEIRQLFDLLGNGWGRRWLAGIDPPWAQADAADIARFLQRWQLSRLALLRSGYQGLHALIMAAWYGNPRSWAAIGYAQPAQVMAVLP